ncbi:MAG: hypothetical protein GY941_22175 [Planctomycetes bacterium]|nr:hypothetical protein [Planctomycetota bacterium]
MKNKRQLLGYWNRLKQATAWEESGNHPSDAIRVKHGTDILYITQNSSTVYIHCNGSNSLPEWISNLFAFPPKRGFHRAYYNKAKHMLKKIDLASMSYKRVKVICHSRGIYGAILANMISLTMQNDKVEVVSFGAPEFMTRRGAKKFKTPHTRVDMERDFITGIVPFTFKYFATETHMLKTVKGEIDHLAYGTALERDLNANKRNK